LGGVTLFMLLVQLFFIRDYLRLPFSTQYWVFTFPIAVLGNIGIRYAAGLRFTGWQVAGWAALAVSSALILAIVFATLLRIRSTR
jgi:tellurite resistance protein